MQEAGRGDLCVVECDGPPEPVAGAKKISATPLVLRLLAAARESTPPRLTDGATEPDLAPRSSRPAGRAGESGGLVRGTRARRAGERRLRLRQQASEVGAYLVGMTVDPRGVLLDQPGIRGLRSSAGKFGWRSATTSSSAIVPILGLSRSARGSRSDDAIWDRSSE